MDIASEIKEAIEGRRCLPISRPALKRMVNTSMWDELGKMFEFTPKWTEFHGIRCFDWSSCSPAFWAAFQPESFSPEAQAKRAKKRRLHEEARKLMFPPADDVTANKPHNGIDHLVTKYNGVRRAWNTKEERLIKQLAERKVVRTGSHREQTYKKQEGICWYCKKLIVWEEWTLDHRIPISRGGTNQWPNKVGACTTCNHGKANMTEQEFLTVAPEDRKAFVTKLQKLCKPI